MSIPDVSEENPFDFGIDPDLEEFRGPQGDRVAIIRTSDRMNFKRCRRRWGWQSHLRGNLSSLEQAAPLWYGSGFHYALEDFHGHKKHPSAVAAFEAYVKATYKQSKQTGILLPYNWDELTVLGRGMLDYYVDTWLIARDPLRTFVYKGRPQVEVNAVIEIPYSTPHYDRVLYAVTLDRIVEDDNGHLWVVDYKTAKRIQTLFFQTDPQVSAYSWVASTMYPDREVVGFIYQQHRKDVPDFPKVLANGRLSINAKQKTTHRHYRACLQNQYGDVLNAPKENIDFLNWLVGQEDENRDFFVRRDRIFRNEHQIQAEGEKLLLELDDMLNPDLPLYPNPTRECGSMCHFNVPCINMDDGSDWEGELEMSFRQKDTQFDSWRNFLPEEFR